MSEGAVEKTSRSDILRMAVDVVSAYLGHNSLSSSQIPEIIQTVFSSLQQLGEHGPGGRGEASKPAVPIKKSLTPDYLICLEDGKKMKMLKRHLMTDHKLTPDQYRARWGLPSTYPMVAANYAKTRSALAKKIGLGQKRSMPRKAGRKRNAKV
jgi:predicted transcriptional regulator